LLSVNYIRKSFFLLKMCSNEVYYACRRGILKQLKQLIEKGANVDVKDGYDYTLLHHAIYGENLEIVKYLIELGVDLDFPNFWGDTAFDYACLIGNLEIIEYLGNLKLQKKYLFIEK